VKKLLLTATVLACTAGGALAQSANFIGPAVGLTVSAQSYKLDRDPAWTSDMSSNGTGADLVGSWGFAMGSQWVGTAGVSIGLKNSDIFTDAATANVATSKQRVSLSFAPGYRIGTDGLLYGKISLQSMVVNYVAPGFDISRTHQGTGLGIGYAHALTKNIELRGEFESVIFSGENTTPTVKLTPKQNNLNLSLLYRF
jgi:opacity protein-like surface antigen